MKFGIVTILFFMIPFHLFAQEYDNCILIKHTEYSNIKIQWQKDFTKLISEHDHSLKGVAEHYMRVQLLHIEQSALSVRVLLETEPDKLRLHMTLNNWLSLDLSKIKELARHNQRLSEVHSMIMSTRDQSSREDGDRLRNVIRNEIINTPKYEELISNFKSKIDEIESKVCIKT